MVNNDNGMSVNKKLVGVVLVNWNCADYTIKCIASLLSGAKVPDIIVVVDNASSDDSVVKIRGTFGMVHVIENKENYGFTGANNIGISYLSKRNVEYIWILNNDTTVSHNCLQVLQDALEKNHDVAASTCKIYWQDTKTIWFAGSTFNKITYVVKHRGEGEIDHGQYDHAEQIDFMDGCCILLRSSVLKEIGTFDEHFFAYHEDIDLSFRITGNGGRILYVTDATVNHYAGASFRKNNVGRYGGTSTPLQHFLSIRNKLYIVRRYGRWYNVILCLLTILGASLYASGAMLLLKRYKKIHAIWSGMKCGLFDDISTIETKLQTIPYK